MPITMTAAAPATMVFREILLDLASVPPTTLPFVSAYVDLSPELEGGTRPYGGDSQQAPVCSWRRSEAAETGHVRPEVT